MEKYYRILKIRRGATQAEIKIAYRKLSKILHPDVNKAPDATEKFIEINEAYEFLTDPELRRKLRYKATPKARKTTRTDQYQQWNKEKREQAREKAREYARQKHKEFLKKQAEGNSSNAPKFILIFSFLLFMLVLLPIGSVIFATEKDGTYQNLKMSTGFLLFLIIWCLPFSFILLKSIWSEIKILYDAAKK